MLLKNTSRRQMSGGKNGGEKRSRKRLFEEQGRYLLHLRRVEAHGVKSVCRSYQSKNKEVMNNRTIPHKTIGHANIFLPMSGKSSKTVLERSRPVDLAWPSLKRTS